MKKKVAGIVCLFIGISLVFGITIFRSVSALSQFKNSLSQVTHQTNNTDQSIFDLTTISPVLTSIESISKNKFVNFVLPKPQKQLLQTVANAVIDLQIVLEKLVSEEQNWLVIFQNSNELRATGGFMGSYAIVEINQGKVVGIRTEDIYDADGQFSGFVEAPKGVATYLSSGKGLRLPDANWNPDTVKSAEQILPFFAFGNKKNIKGILFVNLDFAKKLLAFLGPIEIPDYNTIVTQENIDEVLRSRRDDFFPGSTQKKHMLSQLLTNTRLKILSLNQEKIFELVQLLSSEVKNHNLQFYSNDETIDAIFNKYNMRQELTLLDSSDYLYLVESNVGINKANKKIEREVLVQKDSTNLTLVVTFKNNNTAPTTSRLSELNELLSEKESSQEAKIVDHLAYINYQRVLVPANWILEKAMYENQIIQQVDEEILTIGESQFKQIGFLITLGEEKNGKLTLSFAPNTNNNAVFIQIQPGLPATKYILEYNQNTQEYILENNQLIEYP